MSVSFVPARHCRRTISAAFTSVTHFIQFVVNLEGPTYDTGKEPVSAGLGAGVEAWIRFASKTLPAHRLAPVRRHDAPSSSRRTPPCGLAERPC